MSHTAGCQPHGDQVVCIDPPQCFAPAQWICATTGTISCRCEVPVTFQPPPGRSCTVSIVYAVNIPSDPLLVPMEAHCDVAGVQIALAIMIARLVAGVPTH